MTELWLVDLERAAPALEAIEQAEPRLAADDRARARQFADPRERRDRLAAYIALRIALERTIGPQQVRGIAFVRSGGGKPRLADGQADFSLSHSNGMALIGVTDRGDIGVDLESQRPVRVSLLRRQLIVAAGSGLAGAPVPSASDAAFLQAWSRLEAFAKAKGRGLARLLVDVGVRGEGSDAATPARVEAAARRMVKEAHLTVHDLELLPGLHGAVAAEKSAAVPPIRSFPLDRSGIERLVSRAASGRRR
jgi:4'-phosphopantetheinyl transferase